MKVIGASALVAWPSFTARAMTSSVVIWTCGATKLIRAPWAADRSTFGPPACRQA